MYRKNYILKVQLSNVECWNSTSGSTGSFNVGETIQVLYVYDKHNTLIECVEDGRPLRSVDGNLDPNKGYRFIVPNIMLAKAIDANVPLETEDLIGDLIAYESGQMRNPKKLKKLFKRLRESGIGHKLQGHYSSSM